MLLQSFGRLAMPERMDTKPTNENEVLRHRGRFLTVLTPIAAEHVCIGSEDELQGLLEALLGMAASVYLVKRGMEAEQIVTGVRAGMASAAVRAMGDFYKVLRSLN